MPAIDTALNDDLRMIFWLLLIDDLRDERLLHALTAEATVQASFIPLLLR